MVETLLLISIAGACINAAVIVYHFQPVPEFGIDYLRITLAAVVGNTHGGICFSDS